MISEPLEADPFDDIGLLLTLAGAQAVKNLTATLADRGLEPRSFTVLRFAASSPGVTQRDLAGLLALNPSRLVGIVDDLAERGLLARSVDGRDRRARVLHATPAGLRELAAATPAVRTALGHTLAGLPAERTGQLRALLRDVVSGSTSVTQTRTSPAGGRRSPSG